MRGIIDLGVRPDNANGDEGVVLYYGDKRYFIMAYTIGTEFSVRGIRSTRTHGKSTGEVKARPSYSSFRSRKNRCSCT